MNLEALHRASGRGVLSITGGGTGALGRLLAVPGASGTVLDAQIPYSLGALSEMLGRAPDRATSAATARALAMVAFQRARSLDIEATFGLGATAALATNREKAGDHRLHVALQTSGTSYLWSLTFDKGRRSREEEEALCEHLILHALFIAKNLHYNEPALPLGAGDELISDHVPGDSDWQSLILGSATSVPHGAQGEGAAALLPGAFNPLHEGHHAMAQIAAARLQRPVSYELSVFNVDKPPLNYADLRDRLSAFPAGASVLLTHAPRFTDKAELFPGRTFVVGADTILRVGNVRYYGDSEGARDAAVARLAEQDVRFLVFGRLLEGRFETLEDLDLPEALRTLCDGVSETEFRKDLSSTTLRLHR
ncbi:MAG: hypothetical protein VYC93_01885 [Pseudomonadota bacterium]|nr:hypothetical protein [Pseudomonadota bacterium]